MEKYFAAAKNAISLFNARYADRFIAGCKTFGKEPTQGEVRLDGKRERTQSDSKTLSGS